MSKPDKSTIYWYLVRTFLTIGSVSFGGYLPLVAMIREKIIEKDKLASEHRITEALALGSLLPGPLAVNVTAYISFLLGGVPGALLAVIAVLLPSFLLLLLFSIFYFEFGFGVGLDYVLMGILPVILAIIFSMSVKMFKTNCKNSLQIGVAITSFILLLMIPGYWTILSIIIGSGVVGAFLYTEKSTANATINKNDMWFVLVPLCCILFYVIISKAFDSAPNMILFNVFAKTSLTLFGGGYVMIPILESLLVTQLQWVTSDEFLLGISLGHITPGPILISAAFFGYKMNGIAGSLIAVLGIFIPSASLMIISSRFYTMIADNSTVKAALKIIRPSIVGMIAYSGVSLALNDKLFNGIMYLVLFTAIAFIVVEVLKVSQVKAILFGVLVGGLLYIFNGNLV